MHKPCIYIVPLPHCDFPPCLIFYGEPGLQETQKLSKFGVWPTGNKTAWMTSEVFYPYIIFVAEKLWNQTHQPHILLLDSFSPHFNNSTLIKTLETQYHLHLFPLIKDSTQFQQPMDQHLIPHFKQRMRGILLYLYLYYY